MLPSGDIVYTFPDLMITTTGVDNNNQVAQGLGESLYEKKIPLSLAPSNLRLLAGALGIVNLLGVLTHSPTYSLIYSLTHLLTYTLN